MSLLSVQNITMQFGGLKAVDNLSFEIEKGSLFGLIGPNGAGKTTVFNTLTGVYKPTLGSVRFNGTPVNGLKPHQIARMGLTRTFQNIRLFKDLSVIDNILIARAHLSKYSLLQALLKGPVFEESENQAREKAMHLLSLFNLESKKDFVSSGLPYGDQRKLEIVRALATEPKLICLDEPAAGLNHQETHSLMETIAQIRKDFNLTILLIEHDMKLVMGICEKIVVLDHGVKIEEGSPQVIKSSKKVIEAYLGVDS
jgi:branched-chain amino acid transport system ATP-binding protein